MRIVFIVGKFPALSQTFILQQITGLIDRGHDVEIFAHSRGNDSIIHADIEKYGLLERTTYSNTRTFSPNRVVRLARRVALLIANFRKNPTAVLKTLNVIRFGKSALSLGVLHAIAPFLSKGPYDILHCHFGFNGNFGLLLRDAGLLRGKIVTTFHGYDISSYTKSRGQHIYRDLLKRGDLFLCVSDRIREKLTLLGCNQRKVMVHRCGTAESPFHRDSVENGRVAVLTVARLVEKKGVEYGIRAVGKLLKKFPFIKYHIVGNGPLEADMRNLIKKLRIGKNITLGGWKNQEEVGELLKQSDILLAPSVTSKTGDEEGIPVTIMEAFAQGLPVVSTDHAGIPEVVKDGESGFLAPERNVDVLVEKLEQLIERPELRADMGRKGRAFVEEHYNIDKLNDRLVKIYQEVLDGELPHISPPLNSSPGFN